MVKHILNNIEKYVIYVVFSVLLFLVFSQVVTRKVFSFTIAWSEQFARFLFVWVSFAGMSYAAKMRQHLRVTAVPAFIKPIKLSRSILLFGDSVLAAFAFYLSFKIGMLMIQVAAKGQTFSAMPWMPIWAMYLAGTLGMLGIGVRTIQYGIVPSLKDWNNSDAKLDL